MEKHRYYFRLVKSIGKLCEENDRDLPGEKALAKIARAKGFAFNEKSVQPALYEKLHLLMVFCMQSQFG